MNLDEILKIARRVLTDVGQGFQNNVVNPLENNFIKPAQNNLSHFQAPQVNPIKGFQETIKQPQIDLGRALQKINFNPAPKPLSLPVKTPEQKTVLERYNAIRSINIDQPAQVIAEFLNPFPAAGRLLEKGAEGKLGKGGVLEVGSQGLDALSILPVGKIAKVGKSVPEIVNAATKLKKLASPEDIKLIQDFAVWVDRTGGKGDPIKAGIDTRSIQAIAKDLYGSNVENISNKQLGNIMDATLKHIGSTKNDFNLGLATKNIREGITPLDEVFKASDNLVGKQAAEIPSLAKEVPLGTKPKLLDIPEIQSPDLPNNRPLTDIVSQLVEASPDAKAYVSTILKDSKNPINTMEDFFKAASGSKAPVAKTIDQVFNTEKFNLNTKQQATLKNLQEKLGLGTRNQRSFADMQDLAQSLGTDPAKIIQDIQSGRITDSEVVALGDMINSSTKRIQTLSKELKLHPNDPDLLAKLSNEEGLLQDAIKKRLKGGTEAGKSVVAFRILANKTMDPVYWVSKAQRQLGDKQITTEVVTAINDFIKNSDRIGLANFVSKLGESSGLEKAIGFWKAGLLTGFKTHEANIISNTAMQGLETIKDIPATAFDKVRAAITGGERSKALSLDTITSQVKAIPKGLSKAKQVIQEGVTSSDLLKADVRKPLRFGQSKGGRIAQAYTDIVFRTLGAEDKVFKEMAFARSISEQARVIGMNKGLDTAAVQDMILNPTKEMLQAATHESEVATFNNPNAVAAMVSAAKGKGGSLGSAVIDVLAPFTKTPTNVATMMYKYSPLGFPTTIASKLVRGASVTNKDIAESFGRSVTGTGIMALGYELAKAGKLTGNAPVGAAARNEQSLEKKPAMAVYINGAWRSLTRISPVGNLLVLGAEAFSNGIDPVGLLASGAKNLTNQTFLKGVSGALSAINDPQQSAQSYFNSLISSNIPSLSGDVARGTDPWQRSAKGVKETVIAKLPGIRDQVPVKIDQLGNPVKNESGLLKTMFDPFNSQTPSNDPLVKEFQRVGYNLNYVGDTINKVTLTRTQQDEYQKLAGQYIQQILPDIINSSDYQSQDISTQQDMIDKAVNSAKSQARKEIKNKLDQITSDSGGSVAQATELTTPTSKATTPNINLDKTTYAHSKDAPNGIVGGAAITGQGLLTDPTATIKAVLAGNPIRKVEGGAVILERQNDIGALDNGNNTTQIDHITALTLGGFNPSKSINQIEKDIKGMSPNDAKAYLARNNLQVLTNAENQVKGEVETNLYKQLKEGSITKAEAQKRDLNWRNEVKNLPASAQAKLVNNLATPTPGGNLTTNITTKKGNLTTFTYTTKSKQLKTIDLTPYVNNTATGLDKIQLDSKKASIALEVFKSSKPEADKQKVYDTLGYSSEDVRYANLSKLKVDEKAAYIADKNLDHNTLIERLVTGRRKSIAGAIFVTDEVVTQLQNAGLISASEAKSLKKIKFDAKGKNVSKKSGSGTGKSSKAYLKALASFLEESSKGSQKLFLDQIKPVKSSVSSLDAVLKGSSTQKSRSTTIDDILSRSEKIVKNKATLKKKVA